LLAAARSDKKAREGRTGPRRQIRCALPRALGRMDREAGYTRAVPEKLLLAVLRGRGLAR
jgi:hypothetical protein